MDAGYDGWQIVGIDLHRRRSVIVRMDPRPASASIRCVSTTTGHVGGADRQVFLRRPQCWDTGQVRRPFDRRSGFTRSELPPAKLGHTA